MKNYILITTFVFSGFVISCNEKAERKDVVSQEVSSQILSKEDAEKLQKVEEILADFPSVKAEIISGTIVLTGNVSATQERKIKEAIEPLNIGEYTNNLVIK